MMIRTFMILSVILTSCFELPVYTQQTKEDRTVIDEIAVTSGSYQQRDDDGKIAGALIGGATGLFLGHEEGVLGAVIKTAVGAGTGASLGGLVDKSTLRTNVVVECSFRVAVSTETYVYHGSIEDNDAAFQKCALLKKGDPITVSYTEYFQDNQKTHSNRIWKSGDTSGRLN